MNYSNSEQIKFEHLPFEIIQKKENSMVQLGLIVLETDLTIESEMHQFLSQNAGVSPSFSLMHTRIPCDDTVNAKNLSMMEKKFETTLKLFPKNYEFDVIGYGCTSASLLIGEEKILKIVKSAVSSKEVTTPMTAVKRGLKSLKVEKIGYLAPYVSNIAQRMCHNLAEHGFEIAASATFGEDKDSVVGNICPESILQAIEALTLQQKEIDAIFVACTSLKCASIISKAEEKFGIPIISSNSALAWDMARLARLKVSEMGKGSLFSGASYYV